MTLPAISNPKEIKYNGLSACFPKNKNDSKKIHIGCMAPTIGKTFETSKNFTAEYKK